MESEIAKKKEIWAEVHESSKSKNYYSIEYFADKAMHYALPKHLKKACKNILSNSIRKKFA